MDLPDVAQALWIVGLVVAYLSLPILLVVLTRILVAASKISSYAKSTRDHTALLPKHLEALPALDQTAKLLAKARKTAETIAVGAESLAGVLLRRAGAKR